MSSNWQPMLGAQPQADGARFRVWAPEAQSVAVIVEIGSARTAPTSLKRDNNGYFSGTISGVRPGDRYRYSVNDHGLFPDPASRFQPEGVHGPSQVIDPNQFAWTDGAWSGLDKTKLVIYELHVGAFTPEGTFAGVIERLPYLAGLGITAIELMPIADFPGRRNWGYDGASLFAPAHTYGTPDELRQLIDKAHRCGLAVLLDVVWNRSGPDGSYLHQFSPYYFEGSHSTPWGPAFNVDGEHSQEVRNFLTENALYWLHDYHFDGLRLDATRFAEDASRQPVLVDLVERVRRALPDRQLFFIADDGNNRAKIVRPASEGGWGFDAVWTDDFHHQIRRRLAGDDEAHFRDFTGSAEDIAATLQMGWFYRGQTSVHRGAPHGTNPEGIPPHRFVIGIQNHNGIGNRALGDRLNRQTDGAAFRAASALLLCAPQTPSLFMGQEWSASAPFMYFTEHHAALGQHVAAGRLREFRDYSAFSDPQARIPDPQAETTFLASKLDWLEKNSEPHDRTLWLIRELLRLRHKESALHSGHHEATAADGVVLLRRWADHGDALLIAVALQPGCRCQLPIDSNSHWSVVLTTEMDLFTTTPRPPVVELSASAPSIEFVAPAAVILKNGAPR